jgi:hypothetical protein
MILDRFLMDQTFDLIESGYRFLAAGNNILGSVQFGLYRIVN